MSKERNGEHWLTRQELFEAAWDRPLTKVAAELGVTSTALKKTCDRHDIPTPRRGYWAAVRSGKVFNRPNLRPAKAPHLERVRVRGALASISGGGKGTLDTPAAKVSEPVTKAVPPSPPAPHPTIPKITVPSTLAAPHWIVAAWIEEERRDRETYRRLGWSLQHRQPTDIAKRTRLILNGLFKALESRGHKVTTDRGWIYQAHLLIQGHRFEYRVVERYTQRREALSSDELRKPENASVNRRFRQVREMTGQLQVTITGPCYEKAVWRDEPGRTLEEQFGEVVLGIEKLGNIATDGRARRAEAERLRWEEERRRADIQRERRRDENQWRRLREVALQDEETQRMRRFVNTLHRRVEAGGPVDEETSGWLKWAEEWIAAWDPLAEGVGAVIAQVKRVTDQDYRN